MEPLAKKQRERIIDSAYALALRDGISSLSVRKAANEASIGPSTLRYYFPSQDELRIAVVDRFLENTLSDAHILDSSLRPSDRMIECLQQFLPSSKTQESSSALWSETAETGVPSPDLELTNQILGIATSHTHRRIAHWLSVLREEGALLPNELNQTITLLCALVNGLSIDLNSHSPSISHTEAVAILRKVVDKLVLAEDQKAFNNEASLPTNGPTLPPHSF